MMVAEHAVDRREVTWNLVLQYSTVALMLVQGVLLIPLYLKFIGSAEFGVWLVASGVATWIAIVDPGVATLMQQRIAQALGAARSAHAARLVRQGLRLSLALALAVVVIGAAGSGWLLHVIDPKAQMPEATGWWLLFLSVVGVALGLLASYATAVGVALRDARPHTMIAVVSALVGISATVVLLLAGRGVVALPAGAVVRGVLQAGLSYRLVRVELARLQAAGGEAQNDERDSPVELRLLAWSGLEKITGTLAMSVDLFLIGRVLDGGMVTSYALTKRPVDMLVSLFQRPAVAVSPTVSFLSGRGETGRLNEIVTQASRRLLWLLGGAAVGTLFLLQPLVSVWVGPTHYLGDHAAAILALMLVASVFSGLFANLYWASGATTNFCRVNSGLSVLTIAGMLVGLRFYSVTGLMVGALGPRLLLATWLFPWLALKALHMGREARRSIWREGATVGVALLFGGGVALGTQQVMSAPAGWSGLGGLIAYAAVLVFTSGALQREIQTLAGAGAAR